MYTYVYIYTYIHIYTYIYIYVYIYIYIHQRRSAHAGCARATAGLATAKCWRYPTVASCAHLGGDLRALSGGTYRTLTKILKSHLTANLRRVHIVTSRLWEFCCCALWGSKYRPLRCIRVGGGNVSIGKDSQKSKILKSRLCGHFVQGIGCCSVLQYESFRTCHLSHNLFTRYSSTRPFSRCVCRPSATRCNALQHAATHCRELQQSRAQQPRRCSLSFSVCTKLNDTLQCWENAHTHTHIHIHTHYTHTMLNDTLQCWEIALPSLPRTKAFQLVWAGPLRHIAKHCNAL